MTIFGVDVSEHQNGMSLTQAKREGISFAILRLCDGTYRDKVFHSHLKDAERAGLLIATYWYLRAPSEGTTIAQQVDVIDQQMGGRRDLPVWIDVESVAGNRKLLTEADVWVAKRELEKRGYHVSGIYSGAWYWENMPGGEPSMSGLGALWVSNYGRNRTLPYRAAYDGDGGDNHRGWDYPLGNKKPDILQYGSNGLVAGFKVDVNAYRGTIDQLKHLFTGTRATPPAPRPERERKPMEKMLDYRRDQIWQDTGYNCGPASAQTIIRAATGVLLSEATLAREMGTTTRGTDWIGQIKPVLDKHAPAGKWALAEMPNDPPTTAQRDQLWQRVTASIDAGFGVLANIVAPPSNYPRASYKSRQNLAYSGGTVYHYLCVMGYAVDDAGQRHVWLADSGFKPYGSWVTFEQLSTMIPPKGYLYSTVVKKKEAPMTAPLTLNTPCKSHVPGSKHIAPLADYIMYADAGVFALRQQVGELQKQNAEVLKQLDELRQLVANNK